MRYLQISVFILFILPPSLLSQTFPWVKQSTGNGSGEGWATSIDPFGNIYIAGSFDGSNIQFGTYTLTNTGGSSVFLVKYTSSGTLVWAKQGLGNGMDRGYNISTDQLGHVYLCGVFSGSTITLGACTATLTYQGGQDIFLAKFDSNGNCLWLKSFGANINDVPNSICCDASGNIYMAGRYTIQPITFGTYTLTNNGAADGFFLRTDSLGNILWAKNLGSIQNESANGISTDSYGNLYLAGVFNSPSIALDSFTISTAGGYSAFLAKCDANGNFIWVKNTIGNSNDIALSVSADAFGNSVITGFFNSQMIALDSYSLVNQSNSKNVFIAKYNSGGSVQWAKNIIGYNDYGYSAAINSSDIFVTGSIGGSSITVDNYTFTPPVGATDPMFITHFDTNGNLIYGTALASGGDDNSAVCLDNFCNAYIVGDNKCNPMIIGTNTLFLSGNEDVFLIKHFYNCQPLFLKPIEEDFITTRIFPNPAQDYIVIQGRSNEPFYVSISDASGRVLQKEKILITDVEGKLNLNLQNGIYFVILTDSQKRSVVQKLIISK